MEAKRIKFERTGGFAGIRFAADFELNELPEDQAHQILELLDDMDFEELAEDLMSHPAMPDQFSYSITVEAEKWTHTVNTTDGSVPEKLHALLQTLTQIAKQQARTKK